MNSKTFTLDFFPITEGYVQPSGSSYEYVYQYKDHLGNVRLSYSDKDNNGIVNNTEIIEENNYYPFGLAHKGYNSNVVSTNPAQKYKYNGKELQDDFGLNFYDFGARNYDPAIGRWMNMDPLAETSRRWSPYQYVYNNPMRFVDPDGMQANDIILSKSMTKEERTVVMNNLQKLTNDKLKFNEKTNKVEIASKGSGDKESGTYLIRELINHEKNVTIDYSSSDFSSYEKATNEQNSTNGVGSDSEVSLGGINPKALVEDSKTGTSVAETQPGFVVLGHELSHSLATMDGASETYSKTYAHYFTNRYGEKEIEKQPIEEYKTVGFDGFKRTSNKRNFYPTENSIRKENKINKRISYSNGKL